MEFVTRGPYKFQPKEWPKKRVYTRSLANSFCKSHADVLKEAGCYIFAFKAAKGYKPWYIGKTDKSFLSETFTNDKLQKYNEAVDRIKRGTGQLFFLLASGCHSEKRKLRIKELENYLIQEAAKKNPKLINIKHASGPDWGIRGVFRSYKGSSNVASRSLKQVMSW